MSTLSLRDRSFNALSERTFYGWVIVAIAGLGAFASGPGQSHTFSVFVGPISRDLDISSTTIASAYGLATLAAAFLLPVLGRRVDSIGPRKVMVIVTLLLGVACIGFGAASNILWLGFGFGALRFLGQGSMLLTSANLVSQWFDRKRGFALGLMIIGFGASMAVHPPLAQYLIEAVGWRSAWIILGALTWIIMLPPALLLLHNKPEDKGLLPDGARHEADDGTGASQARAQAGLTLKEALETSTFYIITAGVFAIAMLITALHFYQVSIFTTQGLTAKTAAFVFPISATTMVIAMPIIGRMFDTVRTRFMFIAVLLVTTASLVLVTLVTSLPIAVIYAMIFGLNNALMMNMISYIWPRYFGRKHLGSIQGTGQMVGVVGASVGPLPIGLAFDLIGNATLTLQLLAIFPAACAVLALFLRTPPAMAEYAPAD